MDAQHVGLEVALLGGAVWAVAALEGLVGRPTCRENETDELQKRVLTHTTTFHSHSCGIQSATNPPHVTDTSL